MKVVLGLIAFTTLLYSTFSQILAIDFGTEFIKSAVVNSGTGKSFSIVNNHKSERKFLNSVIPILSRLASIVKKDSMKQSPSPRDQGFPPIASSSQNYWPIHSSIQRFHPRLKRISCFLISRRMKKTN